MGIVLILLSVWVWALYGRISGSQFRSKIAAALEKGIPAGCLVLFLITVKNYWLGFSPPTSQKDALNLSLPFSEGTFVVRAGGSNEFLNHHFPNIRQRYAIDISRNDYMGLIADLVRFLPMSSVIPSGKSDYDSSRNSIFSIWGTSVVSPCDGSVISIDDRWSDLGANSPTPVTALDFPGGNFVDIRCDSRPDITVHLAHLMMESITVKVGDRVSSATVLGRVGNSGNTTEPHLHMEAYNSKKEGVPMLIDRRFLINGSIASPLPLAP